MLFHLDAMTSPILPGNFTVYSGLALIQHHTCPNYTLTTLILTLPEKLAICSRQKLHMTLKLVIMMTIFTKSPILGQNRMRVLFHLMLYIIQNMLKNVSF